MPLLSCRCHLLCAQHCARWEATTVIKTDVAPAIVGLVQSHWYNLWALRFLWRMICLNLFQIRSGTVISQLLLCNKLLQNSPTQNYLVNSQFYKSWILVLFSGLDWTWLVTRGLSHGQWGLLVYNGLGWDAWGLSLCGFHHPASLPGLVCVLAEGSSKNRGCKAS